MGKVYGFAENKCRKEVVARSDIVIAEGTLEVYRDAYGRVDVEYPSEMDKSNTIILSEMYKISDQSAWCTNEPSLDNQGYPDGRNVIRTTLDDSSIIISILNRFGTTVNINYRVVMMKG